LLSSCSAGSYSEQGGLFLAVPQFGSIHLWIVKLVNSDETM
jgi:hypothetical protein